MRLYKIVFQWRSAKMPPKKKQRDPKAWRIYSSVPIVFGSSNSAWDYINSRKDIFENLRHQRKISVTVEPIRSKA